MFQNKSYSHEQTSLSAPVHKDVRTLAYFLLHPADDAPALVI